MNYDAPTPETDAFMLLIDDSEVNLGMVESKFKDLECERNAARGEAAKLEWDLAIERKRFQDTADQLIRTSEERDKLRLDLAMAQIPTTVDAVEREEWRQERERLKADHQRSQTDFKNYVKQCADVRLALNRMEVERDELLGTVEYLSDCKAMAEKERDE
jgi:hypothetical protein